MPFVMCSVGGCDRKIQPAVKPDLRDRSTWIYPECDLCFRPVCEKHATEIGGQLVCDRCRNDMEALKVGRIELELRPTEPEA
jgi:hypothetical protein